MVNYKYADFYTKDSIDKQVKIEYDGGTITNEELFSESIELTESLCSESELRFGCCESSVLKFKVANIMIPLSGKWLSMCETLAGNTDVPFLFGRYKVNSDKPTADRRYREVTAYDSMYDIINSDVADWYNTILPDKTSTVTLKEFRTSFVEYFGLEQEEVDLVNDSMVVEKTIEPSEISGKDVLSAICEINGCFGHIGRNGKLKYIVLPQEIQGLYPADNLYPADDLYPRDPQSTKLGKGLYISAKYEDFVTKSITKLQIRQEENDIGCIVGSGDNCYIVEDNFLVYGKSSDDLKVIADNLLSVIRGVIYRPFEADVKGNPCLEVGDPVLLTTKYELIESYILKRTLKGIQALRDSYSADGVEEYSEKVNSVHKSIIQLKGKTNVLERTIEETKSTIIDVEKGLQTQITQTAEEIRSEAVDSEKRMQSSISQTAEEIRSDVSATYETKEDAKSAKSELETSISQTAKEIRMEASETYQTISDAGITETEIRSLISQIADQIVLEVQRAQTEEGNLSASITINSNAISSKVSKDSVVSEINQSAEGIKISADLLELIGTMYMTGGSVHIQAEEAVDNIIELKRSGTDVAMGTDGVRAQADTREAIFQYSQVTVQDTSSGAIAQMLSTGYGICSFEWQTYSDRRLKNDIEYLDKQSSAELIMSLKPCQFVYDYDNSGAIRHGFIAQDVMEVVGDAWEVCGKQERDGEEYFTLDKSNLIADLVATVQLQNEQINALTKRITALEWKINE